MLHAVQPQGLLVAEVVRLDLADQAGCIVAAAFGKAGAARAGAEEEIVKLDEVQRRVMKAVEAAYEKNRDAWVDKLFALIVGVEP